MYRSEEEKSKIILKNVLTMLSNRIYYDKHAKTIDTQIKYKLLDPENCSLELKSDLTYTMTANNKAKYVLKIIFRKITSTGKNSEITDLIKEYHGHKIILVATDFADRIMTFAKEHKVELFKEASLLQDIISNHLQPKFQPLTPLEWEQVKREYHGSEYTFPKIKRSDPVVKYFALRKGDAIRIIRPSPTSGESIGYRIVD